MCAYKIAPFQARTLPLFLEHVGGYPSITSVLKEGYFCSKISWIGYLSEKLIWHKVSVVLSPLYSTCQQHLNAVKLRNLGCSSDVTKFKRHYFDLIMCKFTPESLRTDRTHTSQVRAHVQYNQNIEEQALGTYTRTVPLWLRYVDGTFTAKDGKTETELMIFTNTLTDRTRTYSSPRRSKKMVRYLFQTAWSRSSNTGNIFAQLVAQHCCVAS